MSFLKAALVGGVGVVGIWQVRRMTARGRDDGAPSLGTDDVGRYVESISISGGESAGASLVLTPEGLRLALECEGALFLAGILVRDPGWRGERSQANLASEIRAHALAWLVPPLRARANPVNVEFHYAWPLNLLGNARTRIRHAYSALWTRMEGPKAT